MKQLIYIAITFLLLNCKAPDYLPKQPKIGEVEYFDFDDFYKKRKKIIPLIIMMMDKLKY